MVISESIWYQGFHIELYEEQSDVEELYATSKKSIWEIYYVYKVLVDWMSFVIRILKNPN